jgi:PadR family transcriptional regulator, regulatory protein PadR
MSAPIRITRPLLDVLEILVRAAKEGTELHGWAIKSSIRRSGATVYGIVDRLEDAGWITGQWEARNPDPSKPRRRFYRLTPTGYTAARQLLAERRPEALRRAPKPRHAPAPNPLFDVFDALGRLGRRLPGGAG